MRGRRADRAIPLTRWPPPSAMSYGGNRDPRGAEGRCLPAHARVCVCLLPSPPCTARPRGGEAASRSSSCCGPRAGGAAAPNACTPQQHHPCSPFPATRCPWSRDLAKWELGWKPSLISAPEGRLVQVCSIKLSSPLVIFSPVAAFCTINGGLQGHQGPASFGKIAFWREESHTEHCAQGLRYMFSPNSPSEPTRELPVSWKRPRLSGGRWKHGAAASCSGTDRQPKPKVHPGGAGGHQVTSSTVPKPFKG